MALQLIPKRRALPNPSLIHLFSTSSSDNPADSDDRNDQPKSSSSSADSDDRNDQSKSSSSSTSFSSYFSDVKSSLRRQNQSPPPPRRPPRPPSSPNTYFAAASSPSKVASLEEIRKNLTELRIRSEASGPTNSTPPPSFLDSYMKNVQRKPNASSDAAKSGSVSLSFDAIRESLKKMRPSDDRTDMRGTDPMSSFPAYKSSLKFKPSDSPPPPPRTTIVGGTEALSSSLFGKETKEKTKEEISAMKTEFVRTYSYRELGEKLKKLRPEGKGKGEGWFSMEELNERLMRLREMEDKEKDSRIAGLPFRDIRETLVGIKLAEAEKVKKNTIDKFDILSQLGRTSSFTMQPPKEHLVEKYFHPDNMSSAEKMKIELSKVRDGFKMSESDCGSARVQVAQLTTKIKHLSSVLHKKDKHSRKGLIAMVQRRKRLLKYLRRTDWDSYCFVLDKLGLRDNPDYKN